MRINDWSSDVCSSALSAARLTQQGADAVLDLGDGEILVFAETAAGDLAAGQFALEVDLSDMTQTFADGFGALSLGEGGTWDSNFWWGAENGSTMESQSSWYIDTDYGPTRSEEHTSELQSLMRHSY